MASDRKIPLIHTVIEGRALIEALLFQFVKRHINKTPTGDGHGVFIIPGFLATDGLTSALRNSLTEAGYSVSGWENGPNVGLKQSLYDDTLEKIKAFSESTGGPVTVIGWSLGGLYARAYGVEHSDYVRQVITLGGPINITHNDEDEAQSGIRKLYEKINPPGDELLGMMDVARKSPDVPFTSIFSPSDGIVHWEMCVDDNTDANVQNISVPGSHTGLTHNPFVLYLLLKILPMSADNWQPLSFEGISDKIFSTAP